LEFAPSRCVRLFEDLDIAAPAGFRYVANFLSAAEHDELLAAVRAQEFHQVEFRSVVARRRVIQYGWKYGFDRSRLKPGPPLPDFLLPVRDRAAALAALPPEALSEALLTEYPPGAPIGWHRDAPGFDLVLGVSLLSSCRFRFRHGEARDADRYSLILEPGSAYLLSGQARTEWQHSIPEAATLRYSITFRTLRV
jgi:alkylated DNA repair dioxygenase AlkB